MKKALTLLLAAALSGLASAVTYKWTWASATLPNATQAGQTGTNASGQDNIQNVLDKVKSQTAGVYVYANGGSIDNFGKDCAEGTWTGSSLTLAGRGGTSGESAAIVLGGIKAGTLIQGFKLTATISALPTGMERGFKGTETAALAVREGTEYTNKQTKTVTASTDSTTTIEIEMLFGEGNELTWANTNNVVIALGGIYFKPAKDTYSIDNISVQYLYGTEIPEPTVLALLAVGVAGLALRRKLA